MEIEAEIEEAVRGQLARLIALDDSWHERTNAETLYTDGDLTLAAYAAAFRSSLPIPASTASRSIATSTGSSQERDRQ